MVAHDLVANVDPVQYSLRLLVPDGSPLLAEPAMTAHLGGYDPARLGWTWAHPDLVVDRLQGEIAALVEAQVGEDPERTFDQVDGLIRSYASNAPARPARGPFPSALVASEPGSPSRGFAAPNRPRPNSPRWPLRLTAARCSGEAAGVLGGVARPRRASIADVFSMASTTSSSGPAWESTCHLVGRHCPVRCRLRAHPTLAAGTPCSWRWPRCDTGGFPSIERPGRASDSTIS